MALFGRKKARDAKAAGSRDAATAAVAAAAACPDAPAADRQAGVAPSHEDESPVEAVAASAGDGIADEELLDALPDDYGSQAQAAGKKMPRVVVVKQYCTHAAGSDCERCLMCCPHDAISLEDGRPPVVDADACSGCGICYGVCDAFASTRLTLHDLHARARRIATGGRRVYLTCKENVFPDLNPDTNVLVLPCMSMLSPDLITLLLAEKIRLTIACDLKYCDDCERGGVLGATLFPRAVEMAEQRTGEKVLFSFRIPERRGIVEKVTDEDPLGRREAFTGFAGDVYEIASGKRRLRNSTVLQDYYAKKEQQRAAALLNLADESAFENLKPEGGVRKVLFPQQKMVLETVQQRPDIAGNIPVLVSATDSAACCSAFDCVQACPTGARGIQSRALAFDARLCVGCGICVDACAHGACSVEEATAEIYA